jgi:hypothetical protein
MRNDSDLEQGGNSIGGKKQSPSGSFVKIKTSEGEDCLIRSMIE